MLAPAASRTGMAKSPARARLSEKQAANLNLATVEENPTVVSAAAPAMRTGSGILSTSKIRPKSSAPPLHLRQVKDVQFIVYPVSLMFYDEACEIDYLKCATERVPKHIVRVASCLLLLFGLGLAFEAARLGDAPSGTSGIYLTRIILIGISLLLAGIFALSSRIQIPYRLTPQLLMCTLLSLAGSLWAIASVYHNDELLSKGFELRTTESASFILFIFIMHGTGRFLFFHFSCFPSAISTIVYVVTSAYYASGSEQKLRIAWHALMAVGATFIGWFINYRLELLKRQNHINELKVELGRREKADLKKEAFDLRDEMYVMTLERYDIADVDKKELEFKSPMEQAMAKLQALSDNKTLPKDAFLELQKVIGLLGSSSDLFKVRVADQLADKNIRLDDETTRYLFDLVNNNNDANYDESTKPAKGVTSGPVSSTKTDASAGEGGALSERGDELTTLERSQTKYMVPSTVMAKEEKTINDLLKGMDTFNFDVFEVANLTGGKPLFFVGTALFKKYNLINKFNIDRTKLSNFLNVIENGYLKTNPYHNSIHASDVARTVHYFLHTSMRSYTTDMEILGLIVASLIHDFDHPGTCFDEDTRLLTNQGFLFGQEIKKKLANKEELLFACYDVDSKSYVYRPCMGNKLSIDFVPIESTQRHERDPYLVEFQSDDSDVNLRVTPNHTMFAQWSYECKPDSIRDSLRVACDGTTVPHSNVDPNGDSLRADFFLPESTHHFNLRKPQGLTFLSLAQHGVQHSLNQQQVLLQQLESLQLPQCDACLHHLPHSSTCLTLTFLTSYGSWLRQSQSLPQLHPNWSSYLSSLPTHSLAPWVLTCLNKDQLRAVISGLSDRDQRFVTSSIQLRDKLQVALLHAGFTSNWTTVPSGWQLSWCDLSSEARKTSSANVCEPSFDCNRDVRRTSYSQSVWCVSVEHPDHLVVAQRAHRNANGVVTSQSRPIIVGQTNAFHVNVRDPKAILYNDRAVLENHHVAQSYFLLNKEENNIFSELPAKDYAQLRKLIIELVLATDLGAHFDFLAQFKNSVTSGTLDASGDKLVGPNASNNRLMIHKMALKCGDLGHSTKSLHLHEKWTHRITEEFYRQGDEERKRDIPISPFMDRQKANLPQSQVGFLEFLVLPLFTTWSKFLELDEATCPLMDQLRSNKEHWKKQLEIPKEAATTTTPAGEEKKDKEEAK